MDDTSVHSSTSPDVPTQNLGVEQQPDKAHVIGLQNEMNTDTNNSMESCERAGDSSSTPSPSPPAKQQSHRDTSRIPPPIKQAPQPGSQPQANGIIKMKARDMEFWTDEIGLYNSRIDDLVVGTYSDLWLLYPELRGEIMQRYNRYQRSQTSWRGRILHMPEDERGGSGT